MPRAYWLAQPLLSSQLVLIEPSTKEFTRIEAAIQNATGFDIEIMNDIYGKDCAQKNYLGNDYEKWDPDKILKEAKFLHFSDWPMPQTMACGPQRRPG